MKREIKFDPAFDCRDPDPSKNYGVHGVTLHFYLIGELGAVQFNLFTNWQLPHVTEESKGKIRFDGDRHWLCRPIPADLGYHSPIPKYDGQEPISDSCELLSGRPCYYDGSSLNADPVYQTLLEEGDAGVWRTLEKYYQGTFGELI